MTRKGNRATTAPRLEALEPRTLLSRTPVGPGPLPVRDTEAGLRGHSSPGASVETIPTAPKAVGIQVGRFHPHGPIGIASGRGIGRDAAPRHRHAHTRAFSSKADVPLKVAGTTPNDPQFGRQWGLNNANDVDIDAPRAWGVSTGSPETIVAVIDSGVDANHPELAGKLWTNPGEVAGNGIDDDHDGFVDDLRGWNFVADTGDVSDADGHGTRVAGIIAAEGNNGTGVAGIAWDARIMPLKILGADGVGAVDAAVRAVYYAVRHGARVINASWTGAEPSQALADAIRYAGSQGVVVVSAAGNEGANNDTLASYPANYRFPNTISVAAVDASGSLADFSNYGSTTVDLAAPGVAIRSTDRDGTYAWDAGTSMAAPFVTGVVALVAGQHPEFTAAQLVDRVLATVKPLPRLIGRTVTGGLVDAARALGEGLGGRDPAVRRATGMMPGRLHLRVRIGSPAHRRDNLQLLRGLTFRTSPIGPPRDRQGSGLPDLRMRLPAQITQWSGCRNQVALPACGLTPSSCP